MSVKTQQPDLFEYVAHIQKDDGHTLELAGTMTAWSARAVYQHLLQKAAEHNGWLLTQHITLSDVTEAEYEEVAILPTVSTSMPCVPIEPVLHLPAPVDEKAATPDESAGAVFGAYEHFGKWYATYKGASLCTYKVKTKEDSHVQQKEAAG